MTIIKSSIKATYPACKHNQKMRIHKFQFCKTLATSVTARWRAGDLLIIK